VSVHHKTSGNDNRFISFKTLLFYIFLLKNSYYTGAIFS
jgi:hypothetical protein